MKIYKVTNIWITEYKKNGNTEYSSSRSRFTSIINAFKDKFDN